MRAASAFGESDPARAPRGLRMLVGIPALDEATTLREVIRRIPTRIDRISEISVLVVDDGSTDETGAEALRAGATVVRHPTPRGVGAAFHTILGRCIDSGADLLVTIDADGQFDPATIPSLIAPVARGEADFATASRFADPSLTPEMPLLKLWGNRLMSRFVSLLVGEPFHDVSCGFRAYTRTAVARLALTGRFTYTQEVFLSLAQSHQRMVEVPLKIRGVRRHGVSRVAPSVWSYGLRALRIIGRCYRDHFPMRFFGCLASISALVGTGLSGFFAVHYLESGRMSPHVWAACVAGAAFLFSVLMIHLGIIGDMMSRHRRYLEELLYHQRARGRSRSTESPGPSLPMEPHAPPDLVVGGLDARG